LSLNTSTLTKAMSRRVAAISNGALRAVHAFGKGLMYEAWGHEHPACFNSWWFGT
jgi:hypothetical protein